MEALKDISGSSSLFSLNFINGVLVWGFHTVEASSRRGLTKDLGCLLDGGRSYFQVEAYSRMGLTKDLSLIHI